MNSTIRKGIDNLIEYLTNAGMPNELTRWGAELIALLVLIFISWIGYRVTIKILESLVIPAVKKTKTSLDDLLIRFKIFKKGAYYVPLLIVYFYIDDIISSQELSEFLRIILKILLITNTVSVINSFLAVLNDLYHKQSFAKDHPLHVVYQILKIVVYVFGGLTIISIIIHQDISSLVLSLGAMSAVLILVFKDTILGLVAGFNLIFNKMIAIGDWIEMPKYGADGDVLEINLTNVKVQNFDKTITTIPTYSLITDSFKNWRGMQESGGRRIKRSVNIDLESIRFCTEEEIEKFNKIKILQPYLDQKNKELQAHNETFNNFHDSKVNGRRQTNVGIFRAYLNAYLKSNQEIHPGMTFLVRQLQATEKGLPIEIYVFTKTTDWIKYEAIQGDLFDHIFAALPEFGLRAFQYPSSSVFKMSEELRVES